MKELSNKNILTVRVPMQALLITNAFQGINELDFTDQSIRECTEGHDELILKIDTGLPIKSKTMDVLKKISLLNCFKEADQKSLFEKCLVNNQTHKTDKPNGEVMKELTNDQELIVLSDICNALETFTAHITADMDNQADKEHIRAESRMTVATYKRQMMDIHQKNAKPMTPRPTGKVCLSSVK